MKSGNILLCLLAVFLGFSCTGVKNMSGSLSKSDGAKPVRYAKHGDYLASDSLPSKVAGHSGSMGSVPAGRNESDVYRTDYSRLADGKPGVSGADAVSYGNTDYNQRLVNQYIEMDKLADVILYELDITDRRWTSLLEQYKAANSGDRQLISRDLDKLQADQLTLYKLYTKIYKNGKSDWDKVKEEVDTALITLRGFNKK
jgi:hypothetical protein